MSRQRAGERTSSRKSAPSHRERVERHAGLLFNVGTIIEDRRDGLSDEESARLWEFLWEDAFSLYDRFGPVIDEIEREVFGDE